MSNPIFESEANIKLQLDAIWQNSLPIMRERLDTLDLFAMNAGGIGNTEQQHDDALNIAHKFAGSLEIFGFATAGRIAHDLELLLRSSDSPDPRLLTQLNSALRSALGL